MINRRSFFGAVGALLAWRPASSAIVVDREQAARWQRYLIAKDWPEDQARINFIVNGEIRGFRYGYNFFVGHTWNVLDRPHKIGDTVRVRRQISMIALARKSRGHTLYDLDHEAAELITLTPDFLKTNGYPVPTVREMYERDRGKINSEMAGGFKWFRDEVLPVQLVSHGWADETGIQPGAIFTIAGTNVENPIR